MDTLPRAVSAIDDLVGLIRLLNDKQGMKLLDDLREAKQVNDNAAAALLTERKQLKLDYETLKKQRQEMLNEQADHEAGARKLADALGRSREEINSQSQKLVADNNDLAQRIAAHQSAAGKERADNAAEKDRLQHLALVIDGKLTDVTVRERKVRAREQALDQNEKALKVRMDKLKELTG